ncbi:MAG: hypothetical protein RLY16_2652 [Bacteroidota bacterium]|jgi:hypothetical protein
MQKKKPDVDVIMNVLQATLEAYPGSGFIQSLIYQYQERGGLSKKQMEGLLQKAAKVPDMPPARLATLEAIIKKKITRYRSDKPTVIIPEEEDHVSIKMVEEILQLYPLHKRVCYYKARLGNKEKLNPTEKAEIEKFYKLLIINKKKES